jgi:hypothetical protein
VGAIRSSLEFVVSAQGLEPSQDLSNRILEAGHAARRADQQAQRRLRVAVSLAKGAAFAAGLVMVATVSFRAALSDEAASTPPTRTSVARSARPVGPSPEEIRRAAVEIQTFAAAFGARGIAPRSLEELRHARTVAALDADLAAMRTALERYPGSERATRLMNANLQRQAKALKTLYMEQSL